MRVFSIFLLVFVLVSCNWQEKNDAIVKNDRITYARGFDLMETDSCKVIKVFNLLEPDGNQGVFYYLFPDSVREINVYNAFRIPIKRAVCMSSTHIGFISELGADSVILGVSGTQYVNSSNIRNRILKEEVKEVGYEQSLNYELLSHLKPDAVFIYGVSSESLSSIAKLRELGIPVVMVPDFLESSPLGRTEWIKFFGAFLGKSVLAVSIFKNIAEQYQKLAELAKNEPNKPKVFLNIPFRDIWYFPGSDNYFVKFIDDAGGQYVFPELKGSKSHPVSTELAYKTGISCDVWLNPGAARTLKDITDADSRFSDFRALKTQRVFNNNKRMSDGGGNDFWESGVVHPELILRDLIQIFHPQLLPNDTLFYYQHLN